ncbi:MAG: amino acid adenylation domain-containing protein [Bacteroidales bacterium]|jgi:amino acid adenylation domain-containing protein|nr:amino acid adenylation domain-containing protein [Bacteroidales bacterium]
MNKTLVTLFENQVEKTPDAVALIAADKTYTYRELNAVSNRLANILIGKGVAKGDKIAFILPRDSRVFVSIWGIMKAGGCFIPIDPEYPKGRIEHYVNDSQSKYTLTDTQYVGDYANALDIDELLASEGDEKNPDVGLEPNDLCYSIYTSGSTGIPKGVLLEHGGLYDFTVPEPENVSVARMVEQHVTAICISTVSFDAFLYTVFPCHCNGLTLVMANDEEAKNPLPLAELFARTGGDYLCSTTARMMEYMEYPEFQDVLKKCKMVVQGGEKFSPALYERLRSFTDADLVNGYGPTETSIVSNEQILISSAQITVGKPLYKVVEIIVDKDGNPLPAGVEGELWIGGTRVSRGYHNRPELNAERFAVVDGVRYYKSGDMAKWTENGEVIILGRNDNQVKLRGLRIELGEIENAIMAISGVKQCAVQVRMSHRQEHLCAWFTAARPIGIEEMREELSKNLTAYMVPTAYMQLEAMPHTPNGKLDVKALPDIEITVEEIVLPSTETEQLIFDTVRDILGTDENLGVTIDLVLLGFTSLHATRMAALLTRSTNKKIGMVEIMNMSTIRKIAALLDGRQSMAEVRKEEKRDIYPLTQNQMGVYFECAQRPEGLMYNIPAFITLSKKVDASKLANAMKAVVEAHPYIKARIIEKDGKVMQQRNDSAVVTVNVQSVSEEEFAVVKNNFIKPFALLSAEPLYRLNIYTTPEHTYLLLDFHHIVFDGTSFDVFLQDMTKAYAGEEIEAESYTSFDFSLVQRDEAAYEADKKWFSELVGDGEGATQMPLDHEGAKKGEQKELLATLDPEKIEQTFKMHGTTGSVFFLSALSLVMSRFASTRQVRMATVSAGRDGEEVQNNFGMLVKTLPVVVEVPGEDNLHDYIHRTGVRFNEMLTHQSYPFTEIVTQLQYNSQVLYAYQGEVVGHYDLDGEPLQITYLQPENTQFPLFVGIVRERDNYTIKFEYDSNLFELSTVRTLMDCLVYTIEQFGDVLNTRRHLSEFGVSTVEQRKAIEKFNVADSVPEELTVIDLFMEQVRQHPDNEALIAADGTFTYRQLNERVNILANALIAKGLQKGDTVSFILHRDSRVIVSMFAIIKAGAAYLPIDPDYPADRIAHYINDSQSRFVLTEHPEEYSNGLSIDELLTSENTAEPNVKVGAHDLCYVIYTSGSTGVPKGVQLEHHGLAVFVSPQIKTPHIVAYEKHNARLLSITTVSFDVFTMDVMTTIPNGYTLILANDEESKTPVPMAQLYERTNANALMFTTARLQEYLKMDELRNMFATAKIISEAGEKFPVGLYEKIREISNADVINGYGPTEITIISNEQLLSGGNVITVGVPIGGTIEQIMDIDGHPLPVGTVGELWIAGRGVARGYWNRPELNLDRFVMVGGDRFYKSGDLARWLPNGEVVILGRNDGQIKLRGLRIELGEIENTLAAVKGIDQSIVKVRKINGQDHLCAWYTANRTITAEELHDILSKTLTAYMVPTAYMQLDEMPHTPNGKINARALPDPQFISASEYVEPSSAIEATFAKAFAETLGLARVGAVDDFFALGGTSLQVTQITVAAQKAGYELSYGDVFANPTPRALAALISGKVSSKGKIDQEIQNYDYTAINALLAANTFSGSEKRPLGNVLLTGATGFLGIHVLYEFLRGWTGDIYCLIRSNKLMKAEHRLKNMLFYYFSDTFEAEFGKRIHVVEGDVTSTADFDAMIDLPVDTVVNCAANVKHFSHGTDIEDINTGGVEKGIAFCRKKGCRYIQISTTSVGGTSVNNNPPADTRLTEKMLYFGQDASNKYVHSKFLAERLVFEAIAKGEIDGKVLRAGNLMARSADEEFQINFNTNNFIGQLKGYAVLEKISYHDLEQPTELTAIDATARAMLLLSETPAACCLFHPYTTHIVWMSDVVAAMRDSGFTLQAVEQDEFAERFAEISRSDKAKYLSPLVAYNTSSGDIVKDIIADNRYTMDVLLHLDFNWPLIEDNYIHKLITNLQGLGFFDV